MVIAITLGFLAFITLLGVFNSWIVVVISAMISIGFGIFGFIRHAETTELEIKLENVEKAYDYIRILEQRNSELTQRYKNLLRIGDVRIETYYEEIYVQAEKARDEAKHLRKLATEDRQAVEHIEQRIYTMAKRLVEDHLKWTSQKLRADPENYQRQKMALNRTFDFVDSIGYEIPDGLRQSSLANLKAQYKEKVREQVLKEEQRQIRQQMREEERARREHELAVKEAEDKEREIQDRLEEALKLQQGQYSSEIEELQRQLEEAQSNAERAKSMAQLTKKGNVYILSNIGSFGENVYKVGMTRRRDPMDRVKELGDASVPFPFDVHAMIRCDDAPNLEKRLHRELARYRVNRVNFRKEYFNVDLSTIVEAVEHHHGTVEYVAEPEALEYRDTLQISPDEFVETERELVEAGVDIDSDDDDI